MAHFVGLVLVFGCGISVMAQPVVSSAFNAAGYQRVPKGDTPIAQGSMFVVFGAGLAGADFSEASLPLPTVLPAGNGTSIAITSGGQRLSAFMIYTLAGQVAAILPSGTPVGPASLTVTYNGQTSAPMNIVVTPLAPGIFTANAQGTGPAAAQVMFSATDVRPNQLTTPAPPGSIVTLYGTGLGPIGGRDDVAPGAVAAAGTVTATIGGTPAVVLYAGRAPQFPGEDQINIQLPANVPLGCYTPGVIAVNGIPSNDFVLSTGSAGSNSCVHPMALSAATEAAIDAGGTANIGAFSIVRGTIGGSTTEGLGGLFDTVNAAQLYAAYQSVLTNLHVIPYPAATGQCVVYDQLLNATTSAVLPGNFGSVGGQELQSSSVLTLSGYAPAFLTGTSTNVTQAIPRATGNGAGYEWASNLTGPATPAKLTLGNWSLAGNAGPDITTFSASIELPSTLVWTNLTGLNSPPRSGVSMSWTGGYCNLLGQCQMPPVPPNVTIFGNSSVWNAADPSQNRGKSFACAAPAPDGIFAIPSAVLGMLPVPGAQETGFGSLGMSASDTSPFVALMTNGRRTDGGVFGFSEYLVNTGSGFAWR